MGLYKVHSGLSLNMGRSVGLTRPLHVTATLVLWYYFYAVEGKLLYAVEFVNLLRLKWLKERN